MVPFYLLPHGFVLGILLTLSSHAAESAPPAVPALVREKIDFTWPDRAIVSAPLADAPDGKHVLWLRQPAAYWNEAFPVGNGRLGAMVFGGIADERLQLNEDSLWDGYPKDADNPKALESLPEVCRLLFAGKSKDAGNLARQTMLGVPKAINSYQSLGELVIETGHTSATRYRRTLDLTNAAATVSYESGGKARGISFAAQTRAVATGGMVSNASGKLEIRGADEVLLFIDGATTYRGGDPMAAQNYEVVRDFAFAHWASPAADQTYRYDESPEHDLLALKTKVGSTKGAYPPGFSVQPNLLMHEVAKRENRPDADLYLQAAIRQAEWMIASLDWNDPLTTKGQRMSEFVTVTGLAQLLADYPDRAPKGLAKKLNDWAAVIFRRSENLWDFRKLGDAADQWTPIGDSPQKWNEVGNVGWSEDWIQHNTPFNLSLAYLARSESSLTSKRDGDELVVRLLAPLDFDDLKFETGVVTLDSNAGDRESITVTEESASSRYLSARMKITPSAVRPNDGTLQSKSAETVKAEYGYLGQHAQLDL